MTKKVNIGLSDRVHTQAKILASIKKISLAQFLEDAINKAVEKDKKMLEEILK